MQLETPDPALTRSDRARDHFRLALRLAIGFVALLWLPSLLGWGLELERFGIRPREWIGLPGILFAPLLHADIGHLVANSVPVLVLGTALLHIYPQSAFRVLPAVWLGPGVAVWLFARGGVHVGASGLVYGLVAFIFVAGLIHRDRRAVAASLLVTFMYGTLAWGVLPINPLLSWETHLSAAVIGVIMAIGLRHRDQLPRIRYSWEGEAGTGDATEAEREDTAADGEAREDPNPST
jgi:membrane associated rhomboid family serine protease